MYKNFSENIKITKLYQGAADSVACDTVNMELYNHGAFVVIHSGSSDLDLVLSLYEASSVAPSNTAAITTVVPIYIDTDMGTSSDVLAATTAAYSYTVNTSESADRSQMVVFEIDPTILSAGKPCVYLSDSGGHASNICTILFVGEPKEKGATLPAAIS
jgi:hypothetical protein